MIPDIPFTRVLSFQYSSLRPRKSIFTGLTIFLFTLLPGITAPANSFLLEKKSNASRNVANVKISSPVNVAPLLATIEGGALAYSEGQAATAITTSTTVTDVDNVNLAGAIIQITGNYVITEDALSFTNALGITGTFDVTTGTMTLTGSSSKANYQTAIRSVKYQNTNTDNPSTATRTVSFSVTDGIAFSNIVIRNIAVTAVNDAPVLASIEPASLGYSEDQPATIITASVTATDVDNTNLASATVQITGNYANGQDVLAFTNAFGITGTFATGTGILTLTGSSSVANYQAALQSVTYINTNTGNPVTVARTVSFRVNDGSLNSNIVTRTITVTPVNDAPVLAAIETTSLAFTEGQVATAITSAITVADVDNTNLSGAIVQITGNYINTEDVLSFTNASGITGTYDATTGTMTLTGSSSKANYQTALRSVKYQNTNNNDPSTAVRTVSFSVNDGTDNSNTVTRNIAITPVNDAPVLAAIEGTSLAYTEDDAPAIITATTTAADVDNATLASASIQITSNYSSSQDVLAFTNTATITGSFTVATGKLTLTGTATVAEYQTALRSVTYENTNHINPSTAIRKVSYTVNDGALNSNVVNRNITITAVNDAPVLATIETTDLAYSEGQVATVVTATTTVVDGDNTNLTKVIVQITGNYLSTEDILSFTNAFGVSGSFDVTTGTMTLTGNTTVANYQSAIRSVKYRNSNNATPSPLTRTVSFTINDGALNSNIVTRNITVTPVDDAPTVVNDVAVTDEENAIVINVLTNDSDIDDAIDPTTVVVVTAPVNGTTSVNTVTGAVTYTPNLNFSGSNTFKYTVKDMAGTVSLAATVTITVNNINDAPVFTKGTDIVVSEDAGSQSVVAWATSIDDGDPFTTQSLSFVLSNTNASLFSSQPSINAGTGTLTFKSNTNANGVATVTVYLKDNGLSTPPPNINQSANQTFTITVLSVNDPPTTVDDFYSTSSNSALTANLLSNDTDIESNTLSASPAPAVNPAHGSVVISSNGNFVYTPAGSFTGTDMFTYQVCDNGTDNGVPASRCSTGVVSVTINPPNPYYNIVGNNSIQISQDCFILTKALNNQQGAIWNRFPLDLRYSFELNFEAIFSDSGVVHDAGADGIMFTLQRDNTPPPLNLPGSPIDARGAVGEYLGYGGIIPSIGIEVDTYQNANDPTYDHVAISKNGDTYNILAAAVAAKVDASNNPLNIEDGVSHTVKIGWDKPTNTLTVYFDGVPRTSFSQDIIQTIFANDPTDIYWGFSSSTGGQNNYQGVCGVTMLPINLPAIAVDDSGSLDEDTSLTGNVLANDSDPEGGLLVATAETKTTAHGKVVIKTDGTFTYTPVPDYYGTDSFTYQICDLYSTPGCNSATVNITVTPVYDKPVATADNNSTNEDNVLNITTPGVLGNDIDVDSTAITAVLVSTTTHGVLVLSADGSYTYTPNANYNGSDTFTYVANDGINNSNTASVIITVISVNDAPVANDDNINIPEDASAGIIILANDTDVDNALDPASITIVNNPVNGNITVNTTTGIVTYTSTLNYNGSDSFTYTVKDVSGAVSNVSSVSITVTPVNDPPVAADDSAVTPEDTPAAIIVTTNDADVDNAIDVSSVKISGPPLHGKTTVNTTTGKIDYTPDTDYNGTDLFTYTINDVSGAISNVATVLITVTPVNDPPVAVNDKSNAVQNIAVTIDVLSDDSDVDDAINSSSVVIVSNPLHGTISVDNTTGLVTYIADSDYTGADSFTYTIQDASGATSNTATVTIKVSPPNKPPVAVDDVVSYNSVLPLTIDVLLNDHDPDNDNSELTIISTTNPAFGSVTASNGQIIYQPEGTDSGTITFTYTIQDPGGLTSIATVTIDYQYRPLKPSEGFSPNNDNNNDTWYITSIERYPNNSIHVFDRWGILVYKIKNYNNESVVWDGRANTGQQSGNLLDQGTYYYTLTVEGADQLSGFIQIRR